MGRSVGRARLTARDATHSFAALCGEVTLSWAVVRGSVAEVVASTLASGAWGTLSVLDDISVGCVCLVLAPAGGPRNICREPLVSVWGPAVRHQPGRGRSERV